MDVNEIELKVTDSFFFRRFEKIDWKKIGNFAFISYPPISNSYFFALKLYESFRQSRSLER